MSYPGHSLCREVLLLRRFSVFYSPSRLIWKYRKVTINMILNPTIKLILQQQLGSEIKDTSLVLMKLYIFICARVRRKMRTFSNYTLFNIHSSTWKLKQNKCTRKCSKRGNTPRKWWFKSNQFKRIHVLTSFCLASDPRRKNVSLACRSIWKRPNSRQPVFRPEVPPAPSTRKWPVREAKFNLKKLYRLKRKLLY